MCTTTVMHLLRRDRRPVAARKAATSARLAGRPPCDCLFPPMDGAGRHLGWMRRCEVCSYRQRMTFLLPRRAEPSDLLLSAGRRASFGMAAIAGAALGAVDLLLQETLPYPWANLANSSAVWALVAFGYGVRAARPGRRVSVGGAVMLVVAVASYYLAAAIIQHDALSNLGSRTAMLWAGLGCLAGAVFAALGAHVGSDGWRGVVAAAGAGAVCFAEAAVVLMRADAATGGDRTELRQTAVITAVLGLAVLVAAARTLPATGRALVASVPLTAVGFVGFAAVGFTGSFG